MLTFISHLLTTHPLTPPSFHLARSAAAARPAGDASWPHRRRSAARLPPRPASSRRRTSAAALHVAWAPAHRALPAVGAWFPRPGPPDWGSDRPRPIAARVQTAIYR